MTQPTVRFLTSAAHLGQCPTDEVPEVCFAGRSNVGKSSLLNALAIRKKLAKTSSTPGKTQLINFFDVDSQYRWVDLPGYGYAKVSKKQRTNWGKNVSDFLIKRDNIKLILQLVDSRHEPTALDKEFMFWLAELRRPFAIVLTKTDKISNNQRAKSKAALKRYQKSIGLQTPLIETSSQDRTGIEDLFKLIEEFINDQIIIE